MEALATKYRPKKFEDLVCQDNVKKILVNQIETGEFKQSYLFCGGAGTGKTTSARIFANEINKGKGKPIEIDGASNNGVDNIRALIDDSKMKSMSTDYKVYIIDEVHMLSLGAFNALLKILEEPPKGVIFILCTTDPQKIPNTILSRVQRFDFKRIPQNEIAMRLAYILNEENSVICERQGNEVYDGELIEYTDEALQYIAKLADGGMRDAITKLDTILGYTKEITVESVLSCLGITSYTTMNQLLRFIYKRESEQALNVIHDTFYSGKDLKIFIRDCTNYILDLCKYKLTNKYELTNLPDTHKDEAAITIYNIDMDFLINSLDVFNNLYNTIKYEQNPRAMVESEVLMQCMM